MKALSALFALPASLALLAALPAAAATLYDPASGSLPSAQAWARLVIGADAAESVAGGSYRLDTTGTGVSYFGNAYAGPLVLDTAAGFDLSFRLRVDSETHVGTNRSGYSVLMVGADPAKALEIAFWGNEVWVYDYNPADADRFVHGAGIGWATSASHGYQLSIRSQQFTLRSDGTTLLSGNLRDYTAGGLPYTMSNFLFFGDDSLRGTSITSLGLVSVTAVPEPAPAALLAAGVAVLAWRGSRAARRA